MENTNYNDSNHLNTEQLKPNTSKFHFLSFHGEGGQLFKIMIVNFFLNIISLGLYYPWARANYLKFMYQETEFSGSRFYFSGTGKEMFKGFIKIYFFFLVFIIGIAYSQIMNKGEIYLILLLIFNVIIIAILPFALHGMARYRLSRSSWRSIRFGYRGNAKELAKIYFKGLFLTFVTFGIYSSWMTTEIRKYMVDRMKFGDISFKFEGNGANLFVIHLKGFFLTMLTCGLYVYWYQRDIFKFYIDNTAAIQNGKKLQFSTDVSGVDFLVLLIINNIFLVFSLGIALPWVIVRTTEFMFSHIDIIGDFDRDALKQTEERYTNATGEEFLEQADLDIGLLDF